MAGKNQHVVPRDDQWAVRGAGNSRDTSHHRTQAEAERAARDIAMNQKSEVLIHGENGRIRERNSYGNDPYLRRRLLTNTPFLWMPTNGPLM